MQIIMQDSMVNLLPECGVYLPCSGALVLADIHLGKSATFRTRGIPVPEGDTAGDLRLISELIKKYTVTQLIIAGDLVHAQDGLTERILSILGKWLEDVGIPVILTEGNHDKKSHLPELGIEVVRDCEIDGIKITHDPGDLIDGDPGIAGHLHPCYVLRESKRSKMNLRGFYLRQGQHLVLPAFSPFTGMHPILPEDGDQFFSITENIIHEIPLRFSK